MLIKKFECLSYKSLLSFIPSTYTIVMGEGGAMHLKKNLTGNVFESSIVDTPNTQKGYFNLFSIIQTTNSISHQNGVDLG